MKKLRPGCEASEDGRRWERAGGPGAVLWSPAHYVYPAIWSEESVNNTVMRRERMGGETCFVPVVVAIMRVLRAHYPAPLVTI